MEAIRALVREKSGLFYGQHNSASLVDAIEKRMAVGGFDSAAEYYRALTTSKARYKEFTELVNLLTIQHTRFFRNPALFKAFRQFVLPEIVRRKAIAGEDSLRILSAGCATGEEPYSIAMVILDVIGQPSPLRARILAADISHEALDRARSGVYSRRSVDRVEADLINDYIKRYCILGDGEVRVKDSVRELVDFQYMNLTDSFSFPKFDLIFCRNVTIYFDLETVRRVFDKLCNSLPEGGYLFVGGTESLQGITDKFELVESARALYYRKRAVVPVQQGIRRSGSADAQASPRPGTFPGDRPTVYSVDLMSGNANDSHSITAYSYPVHGAGNARQENEPSHSCNESKEITGANSRSRRDVPEPDGDPAGMIKTALRLFEEEKPLEALNLAQQACALTPDTTEGRLLIARVCLNLGRFDDVEKECRKVIKQSPSSSDAHYLLGVAYQKMGKRKSSVENLQKAVYLNSDHSLAHFALAELYSASGERKRAERAYKNTLRALEREPEGLLAGGSMTVTKRALAQLCSGKLKEEAQERKGTRAE
jgi:chemotaxis protein methyltransferase CheR